MTGFASAQPTRAKRQAKQVGYHAKELGERICTRLDAFGRVLGQDGDGVGDGGLVVEEMLSGGGGDVVGKRK